MGAIRVTRPTGQPSFEPREQRHFFSFTERFSKTILHSRYINLLKDLATASDEDQQYEKVVYEAQKLIGGKGCSAFSGDNKLEMQASLGSLEKKFQKDEIEKYQPFGPEPFGYTNAAFTLRKPIVFNNKRERKHLEDQDVKHSGRKECEVDEIPPQRLLAVPILAGEKSMGVIRIAKTSAESPFSSDDQNMLMSIANQLGRIIQTANINTLRQFFDPKLLEVISGDKSVLTIATRPVTIGFWDIRRFTDLCESLKAHPDQIAGFIQEYYHAAAETIFKHGGILDKFIGDGVMALFGVLDKKKDTYEASLAAVSAAIDLRNRFDKIVKKWNKNWRLIIARKIEIGLGCGIHSDPQVLAGMVETDSRCQYTALGPAVNLTSRIEQRAKAGEILMSITTAAHIEKKIEIRPAGEISDIKGIEGTYNLFAVSQPEIDPILNNHGKKVG